MLTILEELILQFNPTDSLRQLYENKIKHILRHNALWMRVSSNHSCIGCRVAAVVVRSRTSRSGWFNRKWTCLYVLFTWTTHYALHITREQQCELDPFIPNSVQSVIMKSFILLAVLLTSVHVTTAGSAAHRCFCQVRRIIIQHHWCCSIALEADFN